MPLIAIEDDGNGCTGIIVGKAKALPTPPTYFETLGDAITTWYEYLFGSVLNKRRGYPDQNIEEFCSSWEPMRYETSQTRKVPVNQGGKLKCWMVVSVYRMQSGRYEVTAYLS